MDCPTTGWLLPMVRHCTHGWCGGSVGCRHWTVLSSQSTAFASWAMWRSPNACWTRRQNKHAAAMGRQDKVHRGPRSPIASHRLSPDCWPTPSPVLDTLAGPWEPRAVSAPGLKAPPTRGRGPGGSTGWPWWDPCRPRWCPGWPPRSHRHSLHRPHRRSQRPGCPGAPPRHR